MGKSLYDGPLRSGCWTQEEMDYVNALMTDFRDGALLGVAAGTTLRGYLAKNVHCGVKRVSKKLEGTSYNGRLAFKVKHHFSTAELRFRCERLALLRAKFERSVEDLKFREAQNREGGGGNVGIGDEHRVGEAHHHLLPPTVSLPSRPLLGSAMGSSIEDVLLEQARSRYLGLSTSSSLLRNNQMSSLLTDSSMVPSLLNSTNQGLAGLGESYLLERRAAAFQQQQLQQQSMNNVLESIRMRRSAIADQPFANAVGGSFPLGSSSSSTTLANAALMRPSIGATSLPTSGIALGSFLDNDSRSTEILLNSRNLLGEERKRNAVTAGLFSGRTEASLQQEEKREQEKEEPSKKRAKPG